MNIKMDRTHQFHTVTGRSLSKGKKKAENISAEQLMIQTFKEQNSRENNRVSEIYGKFRAGSELTPEELDYIAREAPDLYRQIKEILMERQALEREMEMAESKEKVAQIHANQLNKIQASMESGKEAEANAEKNMARVNHTQAAFQEFTASVEYQEKEDNESRAEERRDLLKELAREQEKYRDNLAEKFEDTEQITENVEDAEEMSQEIEEDGLVSEDKEDAIKQRKRRRKNKGAKGSTFVTADVDLQDLQLKVRDLYRSTKSSAVHTENRKGNDVDLSL